MARGDQTVKKELPFHSQTRDEESHDPFLPPWRMRAELFSGSGMISFVGFWGKGFLCLYFFWLFLFLGGGGSFFIVYRFGVPPVGGDEIGNKEGSLQCMR